MRRPSPVELMLLATVLLWGLNLTVSRYVLTHGFQPLAYSTLRYGAAALLFLGLALLLERSLRLDRAALGLAAAATVLLVVNQVGFVYALERTTASTLGLIFGSTPIFAALIGLAAGLERPDRRFWLGAAVSFAGVALVATGGAGELSGDMRGNLLGVLTAVTWAGYSVLITPLMGRYSPYRISAVVIAATAGVLVVLGGRQTAGQELGLGWEVWALFAFAVLGPLVTTNLLWYRSLHRIGPAKATLAANLQPFVAVVLAVLLLAESLTAWELAGGALIGLGIVLVRRRRVPVPGAAE